MNLRSNITNFWLLYLQAKHIIRQIWHSLFVCHPLFWIAWAFSFRFPFSWSRCLVIQRRTVQCSPGFSWLVHTRLALSNTFLFDPQQFLVGPSRLEQLSTIYHLLKMRSAHYRRLRCWPPSHSFEWCSRWHRRPFSCSRGSSRHHFSHDFELGKFLVEQSPPFLCPDRPHRT